MSFLDGILGQLTGGIFDIPTLAQRVGLPPEQVELAVAALGRAHQQGGNAVQAAADNTGVPPDKLSAIVQAIGGEGALRHVASFLGSSGSGNSPAMEAPPASDEQAPAK